MDMIARKKIALSRAAFNLGLTVIIGAFGAHGLQGKVSEKAIATFETGVTYHQLHGVALLILPLIGIALGKTFPWVGRFFTLGTILFSGFCYLYAITGIKAMAMVVPFGGVSFIIGWFLLGVQLLKESKS